MSTILPASGKMPTYRFYITYPVGSITYEVFPLNFLSTSLVDEREGEEIFYRRKFNGSLIFGTNSLVVDEHGVTQNRKDDWLLFLDIEQNDPCERLDFLITKTIEGVTTTYWEGYFSTSDGTPDFDKCTFEVTPIVVDDYSDILDEVDLQYNILEIITWVTTTAHLPGSTDKVYTRNRWLMDVLEFLAEKVYDPTSVIVGPAVVNSTFLTDATNPVTLDTNRLTYLTIAQKSDIIRPSSTNPASMALLSWKELMSILWTMFQIRWTYDGAGTFTVEHISYFAPGTGIDLRTQLIAVANNKYTYLKDKMPKYEKFTFMEASQDDFVGFPIYYESKCINPDPDTNIEEQTCQVTTDLEYIINTPEAIADTGFVILCNYLDGGNYYVEFTKGAMSGEVKLNMRLSWANLHYSYFRHNRVLITGTLNNGYPETTFWTARKTKLQNTNAIVCEMFDPTEEITTELGETYLGGVKGIVSKAEILPTGLIKLNLLYGPADNENTGVSDNCVAIYGYLEVTGIDTLRLTLDSSIPLPNNIPISYREFVYDNLGVLQCTGDWNNVTLTAGSLETVITHALCQAFGAADWCIKLEFKYCDDDICAVYIATEAGDVCESAITYTVECV